MVDPEPAASEPVPTVADPPAPMPDPDPAPAAPAPAPPAPAASAAPAGDLGALWTDQVLGTLSGLTKAMYQSAQLASLEGGVAVIRVENDHHRSNCERKRGDVEAALAAIVGSPVTVRLEVDGDGGASSSPSAPGASSAAASAPPSDDPEEHLAGYDVHDLPDAPDAPLGGIAALTEAFPGSEIIEE